MPMSLRTGILPFRLSKVLPVMAQFFDVGITNETDSTITHTLSDDVDWT